MPLDPIVSLSVAIAEAPATCAFLLGSGVSRDAGVPTGGEVLRAGLQRLYQLETRTSDPPDDETLGEWQRETDREAITYSQLLQLITPDSAVRREYLAGLFTGREPGPTHQALARFAAAGLVRVFVTTNFDRLLERALQAVGLEPVVIASDADLSAALPREHTACLILKPHGDYLRATIRNTPEEVASLEPGITNELEEIFTRYGVVVLGYSGSDLGITRVLRRRSGRFGVWWQARGDLSDEVADLVETIGGRVIHRDTAADLLVDLEHRVAVFQEHPSGVTPAVAHDATLAMLQGSDEIRLSESLRRETSEFESAVRRLTAEALDGYGQLDRAAVGSVWTMLRPVVERRLASLLPLALYDLPRFTEEIRGIARILERRPLQGGLTAWIEIAEWSATWLGYVCGALLTRLERIESLTPLLETTWTDVNDVVQPIVWLPGSLSNALGEQLTPGNWVSPGWEFLTTTSVESMTWLRERYPELFEETGGRAAMSQFDVILCIRYGVMEHRAASFYTLGSGASTDFALHLHRDSGLRERVAAAVGLSLEQFDQDAPGLLRAAFPLGSFGNSDPNVPGALESGARW